MKPENTNVNPICPICIGLAGVLGHLRSRGELQKEGGMQTMEWAGRTNDMKAVNLQGLEDVYK